MQLSDRLAALEHFHTRQALPLLQQSQRDSAALQALQQDTRRLWDDVDGQVQGPLR